MSITQQVLATGFLPDEAYVGLKFLKELDGKVFLAFAGRIGVGSSNKVSDGPVQLLGVIE